MNWTLIIVAVLIVFVFLRFREVRHRVTHMVIIVLILLLVGSAAVVYFNNDVDITSFDGIAKAGQLYFQWIGTIFSNFGKVSTYTVQQDWQVTSPEQNNETVIEP
jgi:glucan phosphoethanolaminetransferase (alkaline phosphatase superfamily)